MTLDASEDRPRRSEPVAIGEATLANVASALKDEERLGPDVEITIGARSFEVSDREASVMGVLAGDLGSETLEPALEQLVTRRAGLLVVGEPPEGSLEELPDKIMAATVPENPTRQTLYLTVQGLLDRVHLHRQGERKGRWLQRYRYELSELIEIARAFTQERDLERLLTLVLERSRFITGADAGSIYVVEGDDPEPTNRTLRFKLSQNESVDFESSEFTMPVSTRSMSGYAVVTRKPINIPDVYEIADDAPYGFDASFDQRVGYRTKSVICCPMISAEDEVIGVIQLINKKKDPDKLLDDPGAFDDNVLPFDERSEELLATLATQAGIALENALLYDEIKRIFEGFVRASVQAIEQRDPTTSGHSLRVSVLSCGLAEVVDRIDEGPYASESFTRRALKELEYASLLHDFGKIGVREEVLVKAKKLYPHELDAVRARIQYAIKHTEAELLARKVEMIRKGAPASDLEQLDHRLSERRSELEDAWKVICEANEPTVLSEGDFTRIAEIGEMTYVDDEGRRRPVLSPEEVACLQVNRGSLNTQEIREIQSHVVHTFDFLSRIPWGKSFTDIPTIAGAHHEKLDGSGYPSQLTSEQIPLQSKIMTICDIYDALTARDRPYKKAVPVERALDILGFEVEADHVDAELVRIFREANVFKAVERDLEY